MLYISKIDGKWHAYLGDTKKNQVYSFGKDNPESGRWYAQWTASGIQYVASPCMTRSGAYRRCKRALEEDLEEGYGGVV